MEWGSSVLQAAVAGSQEGALGRQLWNEWYTAAEVQREAGAALNGLLYGCA